ncbi:MAG: hypothetical protein Q9199_000377 [Rusavskia elegans]
MLLHSTLSLLLVSVAAFSPSGGGPCYYIDGSIDTDSSACYVLSSVGASMCCRDFEQCLKTGLCLGSPTGLVGQYDNDTSIRRLKSSSAVQLSRCADASFCPRSPDNVNETCCETHQGTMAGLDQALIAANVVSSIRSALSTTTSTPSSAAPTVSRTVASEPPRLSSTSDPTAPASSTRANSGLSQESKVYVAFPTSHYSFHQGGIRKVVPAWKRSVQLASHFGRYANSRDHRTLGTALPTLIVTAIGLFLGRNWWKKKQKRKSLVQDAQP